MRGLTLDSFDILCFVYSDFYRKNKGKIPISSKVNKNRRIRTKIMREYKLNNKGNIPSGVSDNRTPGWIPHSIPPPKNRGYLNCEDGGGGGIVTHLQLVIAIAFKIQLKEQIYLSIYL